jgi:hypothetical protein
MHSWSFIRDAHAGGFKPANALTRLDKVHDLHG